jgi:hypothetical protein
MQSTMKLQKAVPKGA